jgi:hypothetical protein
MPDEGADGPPAPADEPDTTEEEIAVDETSMPALPAPIPGAKVQLKKTRAVADLEQFEEFLRSLSS